MIHRGEPGLLNQMPLEELREHGFSLHESGDLDGASKIYGEVLRQCPNDWEVSHALGALAIQVGRYGEALDLIRPAVDRLGTARAHADMGNALLGLSRFDDANRSYDKAIALGSVDAAAYLNRGRVLRCLGRREEALASYERALEFSQGLHEAHVDRVEILLEQRRWQQAIAACEHAAVFGVQSAQILLYRGAALLRVQRWADALNCYDAAISQDPESSDAHVGRGTALLQLDRREDALSSYEAAISLQPNSAEALCGRGQVQREVGSLERALADYDRAIEADANHAAAYSNRGGVLYDFNQWQQALASFNQAIALNPGLAEAYAGRGLVLQATGDLEGAMASYEHAIALDPNLPNAHVNKATALLLRGDFDRGWTEFQWRTRVHKRRPAPPRQMWSSELPLEGKTVLLYAEEGFGDTIQFCRYVNLVARRGAKVILVAPAALARLLGSLDGILKVLAPGEVPPQFDYSCSLIDLPMIFKTTLANIPADIPYLHGPAEARLYWRQRLPVRRKPRIGLVWSGGYRANQPETWAVNSRRNLPLVKLVALRNLNLDFYSLQKGESAELELTSALSKNWEGPPIIDYTRDIHDFADTASLIEQLDLVIGVDTSVVHLAGALGKPVWILNRFDTCWRWLRERSDSPWYPTAKLYRQEQPGDWDGTLARVREDLELLAS